MTIHAENNKKIKTITLTELLKSNYKGKETIVEGLFKSGVYIFAGDPKVGKTYLMLQLAYAVSRGEKFLNKFDTKKSDVLYLALEESEAGIQNRMVDLSCWEETEELHFITEASTLDDGLDLELTDFVNCYPNTKLVIIDTLAMVRNEKSDRYSYAKDYDVIKRIKEIADKLNICIILVHHTNKQINTESIIQRVSGTTGLIGSSDGCYLLSKKDSYSKTATMDMSCRDFPNHKINLKMDIESLAWQFDNIDNDMSEDYFNPIIKKVADYVINSNTKSFSGTISDLIEKLNLGIKPNALSRMLNVYSDRLKEKYNIEYSKTRTSNERIITLKFVDAENSITDVSESISNI